MNNLTIEKLTCPYCNSETDFKDSSVIYGKSYGMVYVCKKFPECDAYVGVHQGTTKPLGRLANAELRKWKKAAHAHFDPLWKWKLMERRSGKPGKSGKPGGSHYRKGYARQSGYKWLASELGINRDDCHIGMFDVDMCKKVINLCKPYLISISNFTGT